MGDSDTLRLLLDEALPVVRRLKPTDHRRLWLSWAERWPAGNDHATCGYTAHMAEGETEYWTAEAGRLMAKGAPCDGALKMARLSLKRLRRLVSILFGPDKQEV